MQDFTPIQILKGKLLSLENIDVYGIEGESSCEWGYGTAFGMVVNAASHLSGPSGEFLLKQGTYFVSTGPAVLQGGTALLICLPNYIGLNQIGGPLEKAGRLRYMDGCTDTLLVCPPRRGEPSLNHLHIPIGTKQTSHFHESVRMGVIVSGRGRCHTRTDAYDLVPGMAWYIPAGVWHSFVTGDESLDVIAWHPDSVFGPTDQLHPMILGTHIDTCKIEVRDDVAAG